MTRFGRWSAALAVACFLGTGCFAERDGSPNAGDDAGTRASHEGDASADSDGALIDADVTQPSDAGPDVMHRGTRFPPEPPVCTDPDSREPRAERVRATTVGLTESLTDRCDDDGNLIDHQCEMLPSTDCPPCNGECSGCVEHTGRVIEVPFDCHGGCVDGACPNWCPEQGDEIVISEDSASGGLRVDNLKKGNHSLCTPHIDGSTESHCNDLAGYLGEQVYELGTDCYGDMPGTLWLGWELAGSGITGPTKCFADCTHGTD